MNGTPETGVGAPSEGRGGIALGFWRVMMGIGRNGSSMGTDGRFYRIKNDYVLRGWDKLPYALVDWRTKSPTFLHKETARALFLCDGDHDADSPLVTDAQREELGRFLEKGWIEPCREGNGLTDEQRYRRYPTRYVPLIQWSVTGRCNFRCRHCMMSAPEAALGELSHASALSIVDQLAECGVLQVALTGGEPFVRRDTPELIDALVEKGIKIAQIYTNGALLDKGIIDFLADRGQTPDVVISFDGVGHHDWLRGVQGAESMADRAFALCHERGLTTLAQVTLHRGNAASLRKTIRHLAELGCAMARVSPTDDMGDWKGYGGGLTLTTEELFTIALDYIPCYYEDGMPLPLILAGFVKLSPENPDRYDTPYYRGGDPAEESLLLSCARESLQIAADGTPSLCDLACPQRDSSLLELAPIASDDPAEKIVPLRDILSGDSPFMQTLYIRGRDFAEENSPCASCTYFEACVGGCRAIAFHDTGSLFGADPSSCLFFKGGWAKRLILLMKELRPNASSDLLERPNIRELILGNYEYNHIISPIGTVGLHGKEEL